MLSLGVVYILELEDCVKIGKSLDPCERLKALSFTLCKNDNVKSFIYSQRHLNYSDNEKKLHEHFKKHRIENTEFFKISKEKVVNYLSMLKFKKRQTDIGTMIFFDKENIITSGSAINIIESLHGINLYYIHKKTGIPYNVLKRAYTNVKWNNKILFAMQEYFCNGIEKTYET